jgi:methionyl aminopeptidase
MNIINLLFPPKTPSPPKIRQSRRGVEIKSPAEIEIMRLSGKIVGTVLREIADIIEPGMTTADLDTYAQKRIEEMGAIPSFKGYHGFPASICASINHEVVHGIPNRNRVIRSGDLLKVDTGAYQQGFHADSCITIAVGKVSEQALRLQDVAEKALYQGIAQVKPGNDLLDIAGAIEDYVQSQGYQVVEEFTGHGVGRNLHEQPAVFNFRTNELPNVKLRPGMTLAIEPIINAGSKFTKTLSDRWTVVTVDNSLSAQFEHTVLVTTDGYEIMTNR